MLISIVVFSLVYCILCGIGRLWAQSDDYNWRNAIFRDLISFDWPVIYDKFDGALSYYIAVWLPASLFEKLVLVFGGSLETAFIVGNMVLLIYFTIGLSSAFLLLLMYFGKTDTKRVCLTLLGFVLFSGMDIIGMMLGSDNWFEFMHLEWWAGFGSFQYSSFTTCMCWVFNQTLIPWLCMTLFINEKKTSNYVLIGMACLFSGPFPFVGYFIFCIANGVKRLVEMIKEKQGYDFIKETFSIPNLSSAIFVFPFIGTYLVSNAAIGGTEAGEVASEMLSLETSDVVIYLCFVLLEFGALALLVANANKKDLLYYVMCLQLLVFPLIHIGGYSDFTMRASIPALFMLYVFCYEYLLNNHLIVAENKTSNIKQKTGSKKISNINIIFLTMLICLIIGAVTPGVEMRREFVQVHDYGINNPSTDGIITLNRVENPINVNDGWPPLNFVALDLNDKFFFKYFARI